MGTVDSKGPGPGLRPVGARLSLLLLVASLGACGDGTGAGGGQITLALIAGDGQTAVVGTEAAEPLVVQVTDDAGAPVAGTLVNFVVTSGGGHMFAGAGTTDAAGHARDFLTVGLSTADPQAVEVRAVDPTTGEKKTYGTFHVTALADVPVLALPYGDRISATGLAVPGRVGLIAYDQYDNPASGLQVSFTVVQGGGSVTGASQVTGADGVAAVGSWVFGPPGPQALGVATTPVVTFDATTINGHAYPTEGRTLVVTSGDGQVGARGTQTPEELRADMVGNFTLGVNDIYAFRVRTVSGSGSWSTGQIDAAFFAGYARFGTDPGPTVLAVSVYGIGEVLFTATAE